jgi:hypothetical protein
LNPHIAIPELPAYFTEDYVEPLRSLDDLRDGWSTEVRRRTQIVANDLGLPFVRRRLEPWVYGIPENLETAHESASEADILEDPPIQVIPFVYDQDTFYDYILRADNGNFNSSIKWGSVQLHLATLAID